MKTAISGFSSFWWIERVKVHHKAHKEQVESGLAQTNSKSEKILLQDANFRLFAMLMTNLSLSLSLSYWCHYLKSMYFLGPISVQQLLFYLHICSFS